MIRLGNYTIVNSKYLRAEVDLTDFSSFFSKGKATGVAVET